MSFYWISNKYVLSVLLDILTNFKLNIFFYQQIILRIVIYL